MKKILLLFSLLISISAWAQDNDRIKALKIAFITERLQLTESEAQQFWPIYNKFEEENLKLRRDLIGKYRDLDFKNLTEEEAKMHLDVITADDDKRHHLKQQFIRDLRNVLPAKKIIMLKATEDAFKKRMMERLKNHREGFKRNRP